MSTKDKTVPNNRVIQNMARRKFTLFLLLNLELFLVPINVLHDFFFYILSKMQLVSSDPQYSGRRLSGLNPALRLECYL